MQISKKLIRRELYNAGPHTSVRDGDRAQTNDEGNKKTLRPKPNPLYSVLASAELHRKRLAKMALLAHEHAGSNRTDQPGSQRDPNDREHVETPHRHINKCINMKTATLAVTTRIYIYICGL